MSTPETFLATTSAQSSGRPAKNVLFLSNAFPFPANNGWALRTSSLIRTMASLGCDIHLLAFSEQPQADLESQEARTFCASVNVVPHAVGNLSSRANYLRRFLSLLAPIPYGALRYRNPAMSAQVQEAIKQLDIDTVFCDTIDTFIHLPAGVKSHVIVNNHNVEHLILRRYLAYERNPAKRIYASLEAAKLKRWEERVCSEADTVMVCSRVDADSLSRSSGDARFSVVPNVVDVDYYAPSAALEQSAPPTLMYCGGMDWFPNRDAVEFFAAEVLPRIKARIPNVRFTVAGRNPSAEFIDRFRGESSITFTGTVPDMRPHLESATVCVVPLRIGSGTRLKILEAAAMRKVVISTTLGAEGLDFVDGEDICIADAPEAFAQTAVDLILDPARRAVLGRKARVRVERSYSYAALRAALDNALMGVQNNKRGDLK